MTFNPHPLQYVQLVIKREKISPFLLKNCIYVYHSYLIILSNHLSKVTLHTTSFGKQRKTFSCLCSMEKEIISKVYTHTYANAGTHMFACKHEYTHTHTWYFKSIPCDIVPCSGSISFSYPEAGDYNFLSCLYCCCLILNHV